nr:MAG TPA: hypothetical protein [Caudoviricetes sp.]DAW03897.1 MAG TPA: hypothetical protein [Caudoviricetes sp.]DAZ48837.1 MAG TPA: hypothetical protein [Caudoviricetes sp.]
MKIYRFEALVRADPHTKENQKSQKKETRNHGIA